MVNKGLGAPSGFGTGRDSSRSGCTDTMYLPSRSHVFRHPVSSTGVPPVQVSLPARHTERTDGRFSTRLLVVVAFYVSVSKASEMCRGANVSERGSRTDGSIGRATRAPEAFFRNPLAHASGVCHSWGVKDVTYPPEKWHARA